LWSWSDHFSPFTAGAESSGELGFLVGSVRVPLPEDVERVVALTTELARIPAPTFEEGERGDVVAERFAVAGARVERDEVGNVLAWVGLPGDEPPAILSAHLDTVFARDVPLDVRREGDVTLHGPGVGDDTVAVAALIALAHELRDDPPPRPLLLTATVGEEGLGDLRGAKHLLAHVQARAFVAVEGHMLDELQDGAIGSIRIRATYHGPGGHSWGDRGTPSAVHAALGRGAAALAAVPAGRHVNIGTVEGGTTVNAIAQEAALLIDLRDDDEQRLAATARAVEKALSAVEPSITAEVEPIGHRPAGRSAPGDPLLQLVRDARAELGLEPAREEASSTECNAAYAAGVPTTCIGLTHGADAHRPTERIALAPLADGLQLLRTVARRV